MSNPSNQQGGENQPVPDLIHDFQLPTCFLPDGATQHTVYRVSHQSRQQRPSRIDETWCQQQELGRGSFGCVWLERCASGPAEGRLRAVKGIRKDHSLQLSYARELEAMAKFSHERYVHCFIKCYGWYESENMVFIAMEYIEHGDLQNYLNQPFLEAHAKAIGSQLVEGLGYMHENGFAHRDLKPKNILVYQPSPNWWVKIGDLGISKRAEGTALRTMIGTMDYAAPEVRGFVTDQSPSSPDAFSYTFAVDIWALGELLFRMMAQRPVFPNWPDLFNHIVNRHPFPVATLKAAGASQECCSFVAECMAVDPKFRLTASEAAAHAWMPTRRPPSRSSGRSSPARSAAVVTANPGLEDR
ncbi:kinase-like domain-containing protein [Dactylonectria estremocensis]|uniref:non-specific serine/threonine protein kinase n=1 Tax=Dactylonectria estremocensis TaxID=1079267 RepID=A0A9P9DCN3_9HYPO|nr:kinase-like domain-containing protein [Dactylonectria estremocensis]